MHDNCNPDNCPLEPRVDALEKANEQHSKTHREIFNRLKDVELDAMTPGVEAAAVAFCLMAESGQIDAVTAGERAVLFPEWVPRVSYAAGQLRRRGGTLYQCLQAHTSQEGWEPENSAALWKLTHDPAEEWPEWSQPICAGDAYGQGDRVTHAGERWCSDLDNNVWEPGTYGWTQAEE